MAFESKEELYSFLAEHIDYNPVTGVFKRKKDGKRAFAAVEKNVDSSKLNPYARFRLNGVQKHFSLCRLAYYKINGRLPEQNLRLTVEELSRAKRGVVRYAQLEELSLSKAKSKGSKRSKRNTSGYTGVSYDRKYGRWVAAVQLDGKMVRLGWYDTPEEAAIAARCCREKHGFLVYHGEL